MANAPGTETAAYLGYTLLDGLIKLLIAKGVITEAEYVTLLNETIHSIRKQPRAAGGVAIEHIQQAMLPEHNLRK